MNNRSENAVPLKKADRRTNRTRRLLKEALFALILEKGYDAVTIEDITEMADLGRTTFYLHYRDKEELLLESIDSISDELMEQIAPIQEAIEVGDYTQNGDAMGAIRIVFGHAAENAQLYLIILRGEGTHSAAGRVHDIIAEKVLEILRASVQHGLITPKLPVEVFAHYFAGSLLGMITWWLENNLLYTADEMAEMFRQLYFQGGRKVLGVD
jgi:AcrR family transcriptional regulator